MRNLFSGIIGLAVLAIILYFAFPVLGFLAALIVVFAYPVGILVSFIFYHIVRFILKIPKKLFDVLVMNHVRNREDIKKYQEWVLTVAPSINDLVKDIDTVQIEIDDSDVSGQYIKNQYDSKYQEYQEFKMPVWYKESRGKKSIYILYCLPGEKDIAKEIKTRKSMVNWYIAQLSKESRMSRAKHKFTHFFRRDKVYKQKSSQDFGMRVKNVYFTFSHDPLQKPDFSRMKWYPE